MKRSLAVAILLLAATTAALPSLAQDTDRQKAARSLYEKGRSRYGAGDFQAAAELFDQSIRLFATPHAILYRSASLARSGNCTLALEGLTAFSVSDLPQKAREKGARLRDEVLRTCSPGTGEIVAPAPEASSTPPPPPPAAPPPTPEPRPPEVPAAAGPSPEAVPEPIPVPVPPPGGPRPPRPGKAGKEFQVAREGGDFRDLEEAVARAPDGARILLGPGRHRLEHPLRITRPIRIQGPGPDQATIVCDGEDFVLRFEGEGPFALADLAVEHDGVRPASVIQVFSGEIDLQRIQVTGAVRHVPTRRGGQGLLVGGTARGQVLSSVFRQNGLHGIQVTGHAVLRIEGCHCLENGQTGISWFESASGAARDNVAEQNDRYGLAVVPPARPQLSGNLCRQNRRGGLYLEEPLPLGSGNDCPPYEPRKSGK